MPEPSPAHLDHFRRPRNVGLLAGDGPELGRGVAGSTATADLVRIHLRVLEGRVAEARFKAYGCSAAIAAGSWLTERVAGLEPAAAAALGADEVASALVLEPERRHCAEAAIAALGAALGDWAGKNGCAILQGGGRR